MSGTESANTRTEGWDPVDGKRNLGGPVSGWHGREALAWNEGWNAAVDALGLAPGRLVEAVDAWRNAADALSDVTGLSDAEVTRRRDTYENLLAMLLRRDAPPPARANDHPSVGHWKACFDEYGEPICGVPW